MLEERVRKENGMTLVALVVTIIVLIILSGVSISMLIGKNGILTNTNKSKIYIIESKIKEEVSMTLQSIKTNEKSENLEEYLYNELQNNKDNEEYIITKNNNIIKIIYNSDEYKLATRNTQARIEFNIEGDTLNIVSIRSTSGNINNGLIATDSKNSEHKKQSLGEDGVSLSWEDLKKMAIAISCQDDIDNETDEVKIENENGKKYILGIGDYKRITIGEQNYIARIIGFNHDQCSSGKKSGISFDFDEIVEFRSMNEKRETTGGWSSCEMRRYLNNDFYNNIPDSLKINIIAVKKQAEEDDKIWLLSMSEVNLSPDNNNNYAYNYYKKYSRIKFDVNNVSRIWSTRTVFSSIDFGVITNKGYSDGRGASEKHGVSPGFAI